MPFLIYLANIIFASALSLSVDLWEPVVIAAIFGVIPAAIAWRSQPPALARSAREADADYRAAGTELRETPA